MVVYHSEKLLENNLVETEVDSQDLQQLLEVANQFVSCLADFDSFDGSVEGSLVSDWSLSLVPRGLLGLVASLRLRVQFTNHDLQRFKKCAERIPMHRQVEFSIAPQCRDEHLGILQIIELQEASQEPKLIVVWQLLPANVPELLLLDCEAGLLLIFSALIQEIDVNVAVYAVQMGLATLMIVHNIVWLLIGKLNFLRLRRSESRVDLGLSCLRVGRCRWLWVGLCDDLLLLDEVWHYLFDLEDVVTNEKGDQQDEVVWNQVLRVRREVDLLEVHGVEQMLHFESKQGAHDVLSCALERHPSVHHRHKDTLQSVDLRTVKNEMSLDSVVSAAAAYLFDHIAEMVLEGLQDDVDHAVGVQIEVVDHVLHAFVETLCFLLEFLDFELIQQRDQFGIAFVLLSEEIVLLLLVQVSGLEAPVTALVVLEVGHTDPCAFAAAWLR